MLLLALILVTTAGLYVIHNVLLNAAVAEGKAKVVAQYKAEQEKQEKAVEAKQQQINVDHERITSEKDEKIKALDAQLGSALNQLRNRPSRPTNLEVSTVASSTGSCTGAELYRDDAELLIREATRADAIVAERQYYYEQYESARKKLEELNEAAK